MGNKDLGEGIENFEEEVENLKNKEFRLFGIKMTAMTISAAFAIVSAGVGSLYGAFEVYKDYMEMKEQIQSYVAPDMSAINEKLAVLEKSMEATSKEVVIIKNSVNESAQYTSDIKNDLKSDIRRIEKVVEGVERSNKEQQRQVDADLKTARNEMRSLQKEVDNGIKETKKELETKIKQALDNPLAN